MVLVADRDIHGAALAAGIATAVVCNVARPRRRETDRTPPHNPPRNGVTRLGGVAT